MCFTEWIHDFSTDITKCVRWCGYIKKNLYSRIEAVQNFYTLYQTRGTNQSMENLCERLICPCIEFYYIIHFRRINQTMYNERYKKIKIYSNRTSEQYRRNVRFSI